MRIVSFNSTTLCILDATQWHKLCIRETIPVFHAGFSFLLSFTQMREDGKGKSPRESPGIPFLFPFPFHYCNTFASFGINRINISGESSKMDETFAHNFIFLSLNGHLYVNKKRDGIQLSASSGPYWLNLRKFRSLLA